MTSTLASTWGAVREHSRPWDPPAVATTVVVPHPDDETLLCGGLVHVQRSRGVDVTIVAVTDGEAAYPGADREAMARIRRREQEQALACLGVAAGTIRRLRVPDGGVVGHVDRVADAVAEIGHALVVAPWEHDHHCDHEACAAGAQLGAERIGADVWSGLFWAWHRTEPMLMDRQMVHVSLEATALAAREQALEAHRTQLYYDLAQPVLASELLTPMTWGREYFIAPETEPSRSLADRA